MKTRKVQTELQVGWTAAVGYIVWTAAVGYIVWTAAVGYIVWTSSSTIPISHYVKPL